jgi:hypothetical protein
MAERSAIRPISPQASRLPRIGGQADSKESDDPLVRERQRQDRATVGRIVEAEEPELVANIEIAIAEVTKAKQVLAMRGWAGLETLDGPLHHAVSRLTRVAAS